MHAHTHTHAHTKAHLCVAPGTLLYQAPRHGAAHGETLEEAANEVAEAKGHQLLLGKCSVRNHSPGISRLTYSQSPSPLNGLQCLTVVPNILFSCPQSFLSTVQPFSVSLLSCGPVHTCMTHITDLVTVHAVAMPQGKNIPKRDGDGEAYHSNGKGISHECGKQLCLGWHRGYQPGRNTCEFRGWPWLYLPPTPLHP